MRSEGSPDPTAARRAPRATSGPRAEHARLLRAAWSALREHRFPEAVARLREAPIEKHATRVLAWARLVAAAIDRSGAGPDLESFLDAHPQLRDPDRLLLHYSPERIETERARREFVLPDREPLPGPAGRRGKESISRA